MEVGESEEVTVRIGQFASVLGSRLVDPAITFHREDFALA